MSTAAMSRVEIHDPAVLDQARQLIESLTGAEMQQAVVAAVEPQRRNGAGASASTCWRPRRRPARRCAPCSRPRSGTRAAEGHIGAVNRWFAGTRHIDEIEALCVELLKRLFRARYADHRLVASMIGNLAVYTALTEPGDVIMSIAQPVGGHSSNRTDGPAGDARPARSWTCRWTRWSWRSTSMRSPTVAPLVRPKLVALGASMTLFPFPVARDERDRRPSGAGGSSSTARTSWA